MAVGAGTNWEVRTTGSDLNGGGINLSASGTNNLTGVSGCNTASPVVSSATYNFTAGDVGHWIVVRSGTNWLPGFYQIVSVASNQATLNASIGAALVYSASNAIAPVGINTVVGCASVATPTSSSWVLDYTQSDAAAFTGTNLTVDAATNTLVAPDGVTPGPNHIGNVIYISSSGSWTPGFYQITAINSGKWQLDRSPAALGTSGGSWKLGGAVASLGMISSSVVSSNSIWIKAGTYTVTSAAAGSGGVFSNTSSLRIEGYDALRTDMGTRPVIVADGVITSFTLLTVTAACAVTNIELDGNNRASSMGLSTTSAFIGNKLKFNRFTNSGISNAGGAIFNSEATGCSTASAFIATALHFNCVAWGNTITGFQGGSHINGISYNNSGGSSHGWNLNGSSTYAVNCTAYGNGGSGFSVGTSTVTITNCISVSNLGLGITDVTAYRRNSHTINCATFNNTGGAINAGEIRIGNITLTANPFVDAPNGNFALNDTAGGGALLKAAAFPGTFPGGLTTDYSAIGAAEPLSAPSRNISIYNI